MRPAGPRLAILGPPAASAACDGRPGGFEAVHRAPWPSVKPEAGRRAERKAALDAARAAGCDWVLSLGEGEALLADALAIVAPALRPYRAVFGALRVDGRPEAVWRPSRLSFDEPERLPHALLHWWIGDTHLAHVDTARAVLESLPPDGDADDHLFALWRTAPCIKLAQPLLTLREEPAPCPDARRAGVLERLRRDPVFLPVHGGGRTYALPYTGRNAGIEREQTRGQFFEAAELEALRARIGPGRRIVDVGANTGNHTVYFAGPMAAASVVAFEPLPDVAGVLAAAVRRNGLANVDLTRLGIGLSDRAGRARVVRSERGGLGASRLEDDPDGEIEVARLDACLTGGTDFLKIDVETMEMRVLAGAEKIIGRCRPVIFIEIANDNVGLFMDWLGKARYRIERIFSDKGHSNYLIAPAEG